MQFSSPLIRGTLIRRYKRFLADVTLESGETVTAHCPNSGSMLSVDRPGSDVWLSPATNPQRKLKYTWEIVKVGDSLVGINTNNPNAIAAEAVKAGEIPELAGYSSVKREVRYGRNSRIDLFLEADGLPKCYVEVKNVTLRRDLDEGTPIEFPDAVTTRGTKHLMELSEMAHSGARSVMLFLAQRNDATRFTIAHDIDPEYGKALEKALSAGVEVLCYCCRISTDSIRIERRLEPSLEFTRRA